MQHDLLDISYISRKCMRHLPQMPKDDIELWHHLLGKLRIVRKQSVC